MAAEDQRRFGGELAVQRDVPLAPYTTFGVGGPARFFTAARSEQDVVDALAWAAERGLRVAVLGGGSNLLVSDAGFDGLVLHMALRGVRVNEGLVEAAAGEPWDGLVDLAVAAALAGIECLAGIPGLAGGTPVQNVGAYGQEVAETIVSVRAFDRRREQFVELDREACRFRYRESLFNHDEPGRYVVTSVRFALQPDGSPTLRYADLQRRFDRAVSPPTLAEVAATVRSVRREKGMLLVPGDPDVRSAGSYFKNPIVVEDRLAGIASAGHSTVAEMPHWPAGEGCVKLAAAWLLDRAGIHKGYGGSGAAGVSSRHTLALINRGGATAADIVALEEEIRSRVREVFGVELTREPVSLG